MHTGGGCKAYCLRGYVFLRKTPCGCLLGRAPIAHAFGSFIHVCWCYLQAHASQPRAPFFPPFQPPFTDASFSESSRPSTSSGSGSLGGTTLAPPQFSVSGPPFMSGQYQQVFWTPWGFMGSSGSGTGGRDSSDAA